MSITLSTPVNPTPSAQQIDPSTPLLLFGSCFSDEIGAHMEAGGLSVLSNPFGTLYNPLSILSCISLAAQHQPIQPHHLIQHEGTWHSWLHHSRFSRPTREEAIKACNESIAQTHTWLQQKPAIIITLGTAYAFFLQPRPEIAPELEHQAVANCHKLPASWFERRKLTVAEVTAASRKIVDTLPDCRFIFTVSPIRHMADGAHGNQLSKSTLLLGIDEVIACYPQCEYFPSYEIILDELRDYRFFARDLCHPSDLAADIVWDKFQSTYMSNATRELIRLNEKVYRRSQHRTIIDNK